MTKGFFKTFPVFATNREIKRSGENYDFDLHIGPTVLNGPMYSPDRQ